MSSASEVVRLVTRNDTSLAIGLIVGAIVVFQQPLHFALDIARDVESRYHLDLVPALTIVTGVFLFHQYRKRQLSKAEATAASAEAARARTRSEELERLMVFSEALGNALDVPTLQQVLSRNLPAFARERAFWVLARVGDRWQEILQDTTHTTKKSLDVLEPLADLAISNDALSAAHVEGTGHAGACWFPMRAGGAAIGVLGLHEGIALGPGDRKALGAAAGLIAIALRNMQLFRETHEKSVHDRLTGCFNREHCLQTLDVELRRARRSGRPLSIVMFDIDRFKTINDELGHLRGDEILRAVGAQLARLLRSSDVACRYGGDEFLIILPDTHLGGAEHVAETLRREIATLAIAGPEARVLAVNVSIGLAAAAPAELDVAALISRTDEALYRAKRAGRDRVCTAPAPGSAPDPPAPALMPSASGPAGRAMGTETILVADDEPFARELIRRVLEPLGYTILLAKNATDAITIAEAHPGPIHVMLTDIVMPDLDGTELEQRVRSRRPEMKTIYVSGFVGHPAAAGSPNAAFLAKPFTANALAAKIRERLDIGPGVGAEPRADRRGSD
jgi:diguanylate cyclase (GGDEF)-like protein